MQRVRLLIARPQQSRAGDCFEVFSDRGSGQIDYSRPVSDRPVPFWPERVPLCGHLLDAHLMGRHLDGVGGDGHLTGQHLFHPHLRPSAVLVFETPAYYFGVIRHAVRVRDGAGNVVDPPEAVVATMINSSPRPPRGFEKDGFDAASGRMWFRFAPSPDLA